MTQIRHLRKMTQIDPDHPERHRHFRGAARLSFYSISNHARTSAGKPIWERDALVGDPHLDRGQRVIDEQAARALDVRDGRDPRAARHTDDVPLPSDESRQPVQLALRRFRLASREGIGAPLRPAGDVVLRVGRRLLGGWGDGRERTGLAGRSELREHFGQAPIVLPGYPAGDDVVDQLIVGEYLQEEPAEVGGRAASGARGRVGVGLRHWFHYHAWFSSRRSAPLLGVRVCRRTIE
jgi:hypothetical protein